MFIIGLLVVVVLAVIYKLCCGSSENFTQKYDNLDNVDPNDLVLVLFHVPWCGHCKKFIPKWEAMLPSMPKHIKEVSVHYVTIDCDEDTDTCKKYNITAYPTIMMLYKGDKHQFKDERTKEHLVGFINGFVSI